MVHDIIKYLAIGKKGVFFYCELIEKTFVEKSKFWGRHEILFSAWEKGHFPLVSFFLFINSKNFTKKCSSQAEVQHYRKVKICI